MIRKIIHIDEEKCNGCGLCATDVYKRQEQGVAHRRGDVADAKVIHEDQTELDGAHAKACLLYTSRCV